MSKIKNIKIIPTSCRECYFYFSEKTSKNITKNVLNKKNEIVDKLIIGNGVEIIHKCCVGNKERKLYSKKPCTLFKPSLESEKKLKLIKRNELKQRIKNIFKQKSKEEDFKGYDINVSDLKPFRHKKLEKLFKNRKNAVFIDSYNGEKNE